METSSVRFARPDDDTSIAYRFEGGGDYTLVEVAHIPQHLELSRAIPHLRSSIEHADSFNIRLVAYDQRGSGLSTRDVPQISAETRLADLEAVVDAIGLDRVALTATANAGPTAIRFAHAFPDRVDALILSGSFAYGGNIPGLEALLALFDVNWPVAARVVMDITYPRAASTGLDIESFAKNLRESADGATARAIFQAGFLDDVRELLPGVRVPTLILHSARARNVPVESGRLLASEIPDSEFRLVNWENNAVAITDTEQTEYWQSVRDFLDRTVGAAGVESHPAAGSLQTILFTDLEAPTELTQSLGDQGAQELLREHNGVVRTALATYGGTEVKHTGDGIMAAFGSAVSAVEAALRVQLDLRDSKFRVRIGMNAGEPIVEHDDYFGSSVQLAARVCDRAEPGQILVPQVVRDLCLGKGFTFEDRGESTFKGFAEPVKVFAVTQASE